MWYIVLSPAKPILRLWPNKKSSGQTCRSKQIAIECRQGQALANRQFQISGIVQRKAILLRQWEKRRADPIPCRGPTPIGTNSRSSRNRRASWGEMRLRRTVINNGFATSRVSVRSWPC